MTNPAVAVAHGYLTSLRTRPSRKNDAWHRPCLVNNDNTVRINCRHKATERYPQKSLSLDLTIEDGRAILSLCFRTHLDEIDPVEIANIDLNCPHCFAAINAAYQSFGIVLAD